VRRRGWGVGEKPGTSRLVTWAGNLAVGAGDGEVVVPPVPIFQALGAPGDGSGGYFF
jgi:hypothetical protein